MVTNGLLLYNVFWSFSHSKGLFWGISDFRHTPISTYINHILIRLMVKTNINLDTSSSGWWYTNPSEKWWSSTVGMMTFPSEWKVIKFNGSKPPIRYIYTYIYISPVLLVKSHILWKNKSHVQQPDIDWDRTWDGEPQS